MYLELRSKDLFPSEWRVLWKTGYWITPRWFSKQGISRTGQSFRPWIFRQTPATLWMPYLTVSDQLNGFRSFRLSRKSLRRSCHFGRPSRKLFLLIKVSDENQGYSVLAFSRNRHSLFGIRKIMRNGINFKFKNAFSLEFRQMIKVYSLNFETWHVQSFPVARSRGDKAVLRTPHLGFNEGIKGLRVADRSGLRSRLALYPGFGYGTFSRHGYLDKLS